MSSSIFTDLKKFMPLDRIPGDQDINHQTINRTISQVQSKFGALEESYLNLVKAKPEYIQEYLRHLADPFHIIKHRIVYPESYLDNDYYDALGRQNQYRRFYQFSFSDQAIEDINRYSILVLNKVGYDEKLNTEEKPRGISDSEFNVMNPDAIHITNHFQGLQLHLDPDKLSNHFKNADYIDLRVIIFRCILPKPISEHTLYNVDGRKVKSVEGKISKEHLSVSERKYLVAMRRKNGSKFFHKITDPNSVISISDSNDYEYSFNVSDSTYLYLGQYTLANTLEQTDIGIRFNRKTNEFYGNPQNISVDVAKYMKELNKGANQKNVLVPLIYKKSTVNDKNGDPEEVYFSSPYLSTKDFIVMINDKKMVAEEDYRIEETGSYGSLMSLNIDPEESDELRIRIVSNIPNADLNMYYNLTGVLDSYGIAQIDKQVSLLGEETGFLFVDRNYRDPENINHILGRQCHFNTDVINKNRFELISSFYCEPNIEHILNQFANTKSETEKMMELLNKDDQYKLMQNYITNNNLGEVDWEDYWNPNLLTPNEFAVKTNAITYPGKANQITELPMWGNPKKVVWAFEGGDPVEFVSSSPTSASIKPFFTSTYNYSVVRAFIFNEDGEYKTQSFIIIGNIIDDPVGNVLGVPNEMNKGETAVVTLDYSDLWKYAVGASNGAKVTNKTIGSFTIDTTNAQGDFDLVLDIYSNDAKNVLPGLMFGGLGYDLYPNSETAGDDGKLCLNYRIML